MSDKRPSNQRPSGGLNLGDIYYVLFRQKWLIIGCSIIGFIVAGTIYAVRPTVYTSEATLEVKRIKDTTGQTITSVGDTVDTTFGAEGLINGEIQILSSFDLGKRVASNVPPAKILAMYGGGDSLLGAANVIHNSLIAVQLPRSAVIKIVLTLRDGENVSSILDTVLNCYQQMHDEVHLKSDAWEDLKHQAADLHSRELEYQRQLKEKEKAAGVSDVEGARKAMGDAAARINFDMSTMQMQLELYQAKLAKLQGVKTSVSKETNVVVVEPEIAKKTLERYNQALTLRDRLKADYLNGMSVYPEESIIQKEKQAQIDKVELSIANMEKAEPRLARQKAIAAVNNGNALTDSIAGLEGQIEELEYKLKYEQGQLEKINRSATNLDLFAADIHDLQLNIDLLEKYYINATTQAENARLEASMQALNNANISVMEHPTPPAPEREKTPKMMGIAAASGVLAGLALAFLLEFYVDHTVKRAKEIEGDLGMRLFLSIPDLNANGHRKLLGGGKRKKSKRGAAQNGHAPDGTKLEIAPWDERHGLHQYNEALRDRLISYFDINNLNHKPKLVAVTGSARGAGTSTIAAGLAASLSETGDGNVLLVDMNMEHGAAQQFCMGQPACELDAALEQNTRNSALIQNNLYVVSGSTSGGDKLSRMLPKNFANLIPKLKASDYDYIIFDMPPVARTGVTQRLSGFMDMMLLVVEAEKTNREVVKQAAALMTQSKANVSVVLNKTRSYVPARLHQEF